MWGRAGAHSGSASVVSAFSSPLLAPGFAWRPSFRGRRCYTHLPPGGLALGVIPTGVRLFFLLFSESPRCFFFPVSFLSWQNPKTNVDQKIRTRNRFHDSNSSPPLARGGAAKSLFWVLFSFCGKQEIPRIIQCAQYCLRHARARREAGDCRGVQAASLCGLRGVHMSCTCTCACALCCVQADWTAD